MSSLARTRLQTLIEEREAELAELKRDVSTLDGEEDSRPCAVTYPDFDSEDLEFEWLLGGMIAAQTVSMLVADPGIGKSTLMAQMTMSIASGHTFLGGRVEGPTRALMLQAEGSRAAFRSRARAARIAMGITPPTLWHIQAPHFKDFQIGGPGLKRIIEETGARLAVLDTIGYFARFKENDSTEWKERVMKPLRTLIAETGVAIVLVHHQPKATEANKEARDGRGTSAMLADCDHFWRLESVKDRPGLRDLVIRKNKYGAEGTTRLAFETTNAIFRVVE